MQAPRHDSRVREPELSLSLWVALYLATTLALSLAVGIVRTLIRFDQGTLPDQWLAQSALINAALCFACCLVLTPSVTFFMRWFVRSRRKVPRHAMWLASGLGFNLSFLLFWGLNTAIGFRVLRELLKGSIGLELSELWFWLPGWAAFVLLGTLVFVRAAARRSLWLPATLIVAAALMVAGLRLYSAKVDPSIAAPLQIESSARRTPHIFLILVDTLRADHLSSYGYPLPTSPNIDTLAADGVVFERSFAPAPWTPPSCASLLTSRYPPETGIDGTFKPLQKEIPILPQFLKAEGYRTAAIVSSAYVSSQYGFDKGWDLFDTGTTYLRWTGTIAAFNRLGLIPFGEVYPRYDARELTDRALEWMQSHLSNQPLRSAFMYLHYSDPHAPYQPPEEDDRWREFADEDVLASIENPPFSPTWGGQPLEPLEIRAMVARYDAEIAFLDQQLARFFDFLKQHGLYDESLVILTSDHGEEFGEHGGWLHAHTLYNELLHIPLIVKYPSGMVENPDRISATSSLVDVIPTIQDAIGANWPEGAFRGVSLLGDSLDREDHAIYSKADATNMRALIRGSDKLIQSLNESGSLADERFFDLDIDFLELSDGRLPLDFDLERLLEMRLTLQAIDSFHASSSKEIVLDRETERELRALGYLN